MPISGILAVCVVPVRTGTALLPFSSFVGTTVVYFRGTFELSVTETTLPSFPPPLSFTAPSFPSRDRGGGSFVPPAGRPYGRVVEAVRRWVVNRSW